MWIKCISMWVCKTYCMYLLIHTHMYMHTHMHIHPHTHHTQTQRHMHARTHTYTHTRTCTCQMRTHTDTNWLTGQPIGRHTHMNAYPQMHIPTHAYTQMYTHTHTRMLYLTILITIKPDNLFSVLLSFKRGIHCVSMQYRLTLHHSSLQ